MELLLDPNVAYLMLAGGLMLAVLALLSPGTGLLEVGAFLILILAGWSIYNLPINAWALLVLISGAGLFIAAIRTARRRSFLAISILALVVGSAFLFRASEIWTPAVNPLLALIVSSLSAGYFWIVAHKVLEAEYSRPAHDLNILIGSLGEAKTEIFAEGTVYVDGELWSAHSQVSIPAGAQIKVIARQGLQLEVEPLTPSA